MTQKKQNTTRKQPYNRAIIIASVVLILGIVLPVLMFTNDTKQPQPQNQAETTPVGGSTAALGLDVPAVADAKSKASAYFEALRNCELEVANSYRVLPKTQVQTREECAKECPGGMTYEFVKPVSYKQSVSGSITTELSLFEYRFTCGDKSYPTIIQMIRHSDTKVWQVLNMG